MTIAIVGLSFLRITQDGIGFGYLFEMVGSFFIPGVAVRVVFHGQAPVGLFQLVVAGLAPDAEDIVKVTLVGHECLKTTLQIADFRLQIHSTTSNLQSARQYLQSIFVYST